MEVGEEPKSRVDSKLESGPTVSKTTNNGGNLVKPAQVTFGTGPAAALILVLFIVLRCWGLGSAFLPQIDEISLLNQGNIPLLSGGTFSSTYFPLSALSQLLPADAKLTPLRALTVFSQLAGLILLLLAARRHFKSAALVAFSLLFTTSWYFNYIGRLYDVSPYSMLFLGLHLLFLEWWQEGRERGRAGYGWIVLAFACAGLGLDNYTAPWLYFLPFEAVLIALHCWRRPTEIRQFLVGAAAFFAAAVPFFYVILHTDSNRDWIYLTQFGGEGGFLFPSLRAPEPLIRTAAETFTGPFSHPAGGPVKLGASGLQLVSAVSLALLPILAFLVAPADSALRNRIGRLALAAYIFQFVEIILSPVAPNHTGHLAFVLVSYFILIASAFDSPIEKARSVRMFALIAAAAVAGFGLSDFSTRFFLQDQRALAFSGLDFASDNAAGGTGILSGTTMSDGSYLKLTRIKGEWPETLKTLVRTGELSPIFCDSPQRLAGSAIAQFNFLFLTTECEPLLPAGEFRQIWKTEQLIEANADHGMGFYQRVSPAPAPVETVNAPD